MYTLSRYQNHPLIFSKVAKNATLENKKEAFKHPKQVCNSNIFIEDILDKFAILNCKYDKWSEVPFEYIANGKKKYSYYMKWATDEDLDNMNEEEMLKIDDTILIMENRTSLPFILVSKKPKSLPIDINLDKIAKLYFNLAPNIFNVYELVNFILDKKEDMRGWIKVPENCIKKYKNHKKYDYYIKIIG